MIGVLVKTHFIDAAVIATYEQIRRTLAARADVEVVLAIDVSAGLDPASSELAALRSRANVHLFGTQAYERLGLRGFRWRHPSCAFNWFHGDYFLIEYALLHPGRYLALWQIEYDVSLKSGSWDFLADDYPDDFLAPGLKVRAERFLDLIGGNGIVQRHWHWWDAMEGLPGTVGCFFPCVRLSAAAVDQLAAAIRGGISGYCEVSVPSILAAGGLRLNSLSVVPEARASIWHPHWDKALRADPSKSFRLNTVNLTVG